MKRYSLGTALIGLVGGLAFIAFLSPPLTAQQDDLSALSQRMADLERRIEQLEGLIKERGDSQKGQMTHEQGWQNKKNWRTLQIGMSESRVKTFLGEPTKVITGVRTLWYYPNIYCGHVSFDNEGRLTGWNEP